MAKTKVKRAEESIKETENKIDEFEARKEDLQNLRADGLVEGNDNQVTEAEKELKEVDKELDRERSLVEELEKRKPDLKKQDATSRLGGLKSSYKKKREKTQEKIDEFHKKLGDLAELAEESYQLRADVQKVIGEVEVTAAKAGKDPQNLDKVKDKLGPREKGNLTGSIKKFVKVPTDRGRGLKGKARKIRKNLD